MANTKSSAEEQEIMAAYEPLVRQHAKNLFPMLDGWDQLGGEARAHIILDVRQAVGIIETMGGAVITEQEWVSSPGAVEIAGEADMTVHKTCPDGGTCHHSCGEMCWRVKTCCPLSEYGEDWTPEDKALHDPVDPYEGEQVDVAWHNYPNADTRLSE